MSIKSFNLVLAVCSFIFLFNACSKESDAKEDICSSTRFESITFQNVNVSTVKYGSNISTLGQQIDLFADIYQPDADTLSQRPVIIFAFGGGFISGDRKQLASIATEFAKYGYVAACIDYRLLNFLQFPIDSIKGLDIAIKASHDMKAAVRFFKEDASNDNNYRINPDQIILAGVSAGAITAIQAAYFDSSDNIEPVLQTAVTNNGGIEGNSGDTENLTYDSKVLAVVNMSGAIYRLAFIDNGEPPIISFHGDADAVVPYKYDYARPAGIPVIKLYGSFEINKWCGQNGVNSELYTAINGGHDNIYSDPAFSQDFENFKIKTLEFLKTKLCQ